MIKDKSIDVGVLLELICDCSAENAFDAWLEHFAENFEELGSSGGGDAFRLQELLD